MKGHWYDNWFDRERYEYLINWLNNQTFIFSFPTPNHPAYVALKALAIHMPEIIVPYLMEELGYVRKWEKENNNRGRALWAIIEILWETMPDAPTLTEEKRGRLEELIKDWHDWYKKHLILDEHNTEKYVHYY